MSANAKPALTITETDEVDTPLATYLYSETVTATGQNKRSDGGETVLKGRVDVVPPELTAPSAATAPSASTITSMFTSLLNVFLPAGYPHSVSKDYLEYQIYDSIQAFSSSIAGLLSSRAVLQGVGVGDAAASPTSALLLHILQDSSGRIATILFAHRLGTALEPECKMYRLAADIFNDLAMVLDCLSPLIRPGAARVAILSGAGVLRALCGVAGGSSKASLSAHFAKWGNIGELNAKDSSQETIISLLGMLVGSIVVSHVTSLPVTWTALIFLLFLHLGTNYRAVRAVQMTSLNRQRANIVFSTLLSSDPKLDLVERQFRHEEEDDKNEKRDRDSTISTSGSTKPCRRVLRPDEVASLERIFERDGVLRWISSSSSETPQQSWWSTSAKLGYCRIGVSLRELLSLLQEPPPSSLFSMSRPAASINTDSSLLLLRRLTELFASEAYLLFFSSARTRTATNLRAAIILKQGCTPVLQLKAWAHALLAARVLSLSSSSSSKNQRRKQKRKNQAPSVTEGSDDNKQHILNVVAHTLSFLNENALFEQYARELTAAGWDLDIAALETRPGRRIQIK
ncbi:hypothetical protein VTN77DRAFT_1221 [Rasamsonia byssochlamydoides]|uniref:uncharacterized protein n=1 Tax=Rasamsonia byssochlamydoides TaxID=89139 RepID=UPI00374301D5